MAGCFLFSCFLGPLKMFLHDISIHRKLKECKPRLTSNETMSYQDAVTRNNSRKSLTVARLKDIFKFYEVTLEETIHNQHFIKFDKICNS